MVYLLLTFVRAMQPKCLNTWECNDGTPSHEKDSPLQKESFFIRKNFDLKFEPAGELADHGQRLLFAIDRIDDADNQ